MKHHLIILIIIGIITLIIALYLPCKAVIYKYDSLNRLTEVVYDNGQKLVYTYDAAGNLLSVRLVSPEGMSIPPVLNNIGNKTVAEGQELRLVLTAFDNNGDPLTFQADTLPRGARLDQNSGIFIWTPDYTQAGLHVVRFSVSDGMLNDSERVAITVLDRVPPLSLSIADVTVAEGDDGNMVASFSVSLSDPSPWDVTVDYTTSDGTGTAGSDYVAQTGRLFFPAGATGPLAIAVAVTGDPYREEDEDFAVELTASRNASLAKARAVCTIHDDDECAEIVRPVDGSTGTSPVTVIFDRVTAAGETRLTTSAYGPPPPAGYRLGVPPVYYDIETTAAYDGPVSLAISYGGITYANESAIRLFHYEGGAWVDRTVRLDTANDTIFARVSSFSLFAIFEPIPVVLPPASITWERVYGGKGREALHAMRDTADGGSILAGETIADGAEAGDIWVVKLNRLGNIEWQKSYGGPNADVASAIDVTADGGYIVAGQTRPAGAGEADAVVMKLDAEGDLVWSRTYGGLAFDTATAVRAVGDDGFIVAGNTASFGRGGIDAWLLRLGLDGRLQWQMTYGGGLDDRFAAVSVRPGGGYVLAGETASFGAGNADAWFVEVDAMGGLVQQQAFGGAEEDRFAGVQATADGGCVAVGSTTSEATGSDMLVIRLNATGEVVWQRAYGTADQEKATAVVALDGSFAVTGLTGAAYGTADIQLALLMKLDLNGNPYWQKQYWQALAGTIPCAASSAEGSFMLGTTAVTDSWDLYVVRTDQDGRVNTSCNIEVNVPNTSREISLQKSAVDVTGIPSTAAEGDAGFMAAVTAEAGRLPCECETPFAAYVADAKAGMAAFRIDPNDGSLTSVVGSPFAAGMNPVAAVVDPFGRFVYVANAGSNNISTFTIDADGFPAEIPGSPFGAGLSPAGLALHPSGRFVYAVNRDANSISAYSIGADGGLAEIGGSPCATGSRPLAIALDPLGRFAYAVNGGDNTLSAYAIDPVSGRLTPLAGSPFSTGILPTAAAVDPTGRFIYVTNGISDDLSAFAIDSDTGALTEIPGSPFAAGSNPSTLAIDPFGRFVYILDDWTREVRGFMMDTATGALSPIPDGICPVLSGGGTLVPDPTGRFLYVANPHAGCVAAFVIDQRTGGLTGTMGSPAANDTFPVGVAVTHRPLPVVSVGDITVIEGSGATIAEVSISLSHSSDQYIGVEFDTQDATAVADGDYRPVAGRLIFAPGETTLRVSIQIAGDRVIESDETFLFCLKGATRSVIGDGRAVITIINDDWNSPPELAPLGNMTVEEGQLLSFRILATDPDGNTLSYWACNLPPGASFDPVAGLFAWTPGFEQAGVYNGIRFVVTDGEFSEAAEISIIVKNVTPEELVTDMIGEIEELGLPDEAVSSLIPILVNTRSSLERGNKTAAVNQLKAFVNKVEAQRGKKLSDEQADLLIAWTTKVIGVINLPT